MASGPAATRSSVRLSELLAAWSVAIDVGMAMPLDTGLRVCSRAVRLAERLDVGPADVRRTYYLALLRHIGCTAENPELAEALGTNGRSAPGSASWTSPPHGPCSRTSCT
jgi:hypothetical protein